MKKWFDSNALWLSMVIGALAYQWLLPLKPLLPWLIFFMLFFTFCKINPLDLRLHRWHWVVLIVQLTFSFATYYAIMAFTGNPILAQGLMLCFIMPTATAAPIIAGKLGGSIQNLTTFTLLSNFATTLVVPAFFPLINPELSTVPESFQFSPFIFHFSLLLSRISPLLLGPFFSAWLLRLGYNAYQKRKFSRLSRDARNSSSSLPFMGEELSSIECPVDIRRTLSGVGSPKVFALPTSLAQTPFYLWVASIIILTATVTETVMTNYQLQITNMIIMIIGSFLACLMQFGLGKLIGRRLPAPSKGRDYQDVLINPAAAPKTMSGVSSITAGQAFGQKNTSLGVWMAQTYLDPLSSLGAAAYIIWQNIFNSAQLALAAHKKMQ